MNKIYYKVRIGLDDLRRIYNDMNLSSENKIESIKQHLNQEKEKVKNEIFSSITLKDFIYQSKLNQFE